MEWVRNLPEGSWQLRFKRTAQSFGARKSPVGGMQTIWERYNWYIHAQISSSSHLASFIFPIVDAPSALKDAGIGIMEVPKIVKQVSENIGIVTGFTEVIQSVIDLLNKLKEYIMNGLMQAKDLFAIEAKEQAKNQAKAIVALE